MELKFNKQGVPLIGFGKNYSFATKGSPAGKIEELPIPTKTEEVEDKLTVNDIEVAAWGANNDFPIEANEIITSVGVLNTGLKFIRNFTLGQGIFPCRVIGYDEDGNEKLEVVDDQELTDFCNSRMVRRYLEKLGRDYLKFGISYVQLMANESMEKMVGINTINAMFGRMSVANEKGRIEKLFHSGKWPDTPDAEEVETYEILEEFDPMMDLEKRKATGTKESSYIFVVKDSWSNSEYYSEPIWISAYKAGWIDIAKTVPSFLKKMYENQITFKYHVQIPYAFWDKKFPESEFPNIKARSDAIEEYMDSIEENLNSPENASKSLFTFYELNQHGRAEEQWVITPIDNKDKSGGENLITSAAANSEILFALMLNPNVLGAGMPGGTYAGNQGGSNIREAFLVNIANAWVDRQNWLDPLETFLYFNGIDRSIQLRFRSTILTTLDTGAGTTTKLS